MTIPERIKEHDLLSTLPDEWDTDLLPGIHEAVRVSGCKIVVLDDDPTGTQTVYDVPVLTEWDRPALAAVFREPQPTVYLLTNSRSLDRAQAQALAYEIGADLKAAQEITGRAFRVVSRSDSTLRGHYPAEVQAVSEGIGQPVDGVLIIPFFQEGGRLTIHDVHYVAEGEWLVPVAQTEYARDASFGYRSSNLREWVAEKHGGCIAPQDVASITLDDLRRGGPGHVAAALQRLHGRQVCVVNAARYSDLEVFVAGLLHAEAAGKNFLYRTAASFVRVRSGLTARPLRTTAGLGGPFAGGGLIIAGSHIQKSTQQIERVARLPQVISIEVAVSRLLDRPAQRAEIARVRKQIDRTLAAGETALLYTSRGLVVGDDAESSLRIGQIVSAALVQIVQQIEQRPAWVIAKGGITSSDIATKALRITRATVLGQALPGVPIWMTHDESRWPRTIYAVFPGNVGGPDGIADLVRILRGDV